MEAETPRELDPIVSEVCRVLHGRLRWLTIERCDGGLILFGKAPTYYVKQLAQHAVGQFSAVPIVRNEIEVTS